MQQLVCIRVLSFPISTFLGLFEMKVSAKFQLYYGQSDTILPFSGCSGDSQSLLGLIFLNLRSAAW